MPHAWVHCPRSLSDLLEERLVFVEAVSKTTAANGDWYGMVWAFYFCCLFLKISLEVVLVGKVRFVDDN